MAATALDQRYEIGGQQYIAYGHINDLRYTEVNAAGARHNADHYEMFALAAYYGNGNVGTFATNYRQVGGRRG